MRVFGFVFLYLFFFFFQAEDGIRDFHVTGVQTCALPILCGSRWTQVTSSTPTVGSKKHWLPGGVPMNYHRRQTLRKKSRRLKSSSVACSNCRNSRRKKQSARDRFAHHDPSACRMSRSVKNHQAWSRTTIASLRSHSFFASAISVPSLRHAVSLQSAKYAPVTPSTCG